MYLSLWHHNHLLYIVADPRLVLPRLAELSYSPHDNIQTSAAIALITLLVNHKEEPDILCMLLDCLRYFWQFSILLCSSFNPGHILEIKISVQIDRTS